MVGNALVGHKVVSTLVVLECSGSHGGVERSRDHDNTNYFQKSVLEGWISVERVREHSALSLKS